MEPSDHIGSYGANSYLCIHPTPPAQANIIKSILLPKQNTIISHTVAESSEADDAYKPDYTYSDGAFKLPESEKNCINISTKLRI